MRNSYLISSKNIVIDPISGQPMLGKNLDRGLNMNSLKDRRSTNIGPEERVKKFLSKNNNRLHTENGQR